MTDATSSSRARLPRWTAPIVWAVMVPLVHVALPWGISLLSARHGWVDGRPRLGNLPPLILVMAGISCLIWCLGLHFVQAPRGWALEMTPRYLLVRGLYEFTRNPMFLSALAIWLGWTLFYGSVAILVGLGVLWGVMTFVVVPFEERRLETRFGEAYLRYKNAVPRWLGKASR